MALNTIGNTFFEENKDKVLGEFSISDFRNMITVKGNKNDVEQYFDTKLKDTNENISNKTKLVEFNKPLIVKELDDSTTKTKPEKQNTKPMKKNKVKESVNLVTEVEELKVLTIEDTVKKYSSNLSDNDIKAFVWYNQTLGLPMYGWNKWYLKDTLNAMAKCSDDVDYYNQSKTKIGKFQSGDSIGKITKFTDIVNGVQSTLIRKNDGQLVYVDASKIIGIYNNGYSSEIKSMVQSNSLMYLNGDYVPLHIYSNSDYDLLKDQLENDKDFIVKEFGQHCYDYQKTLISSKMMRVDAPMFQDRFKLNPFGEIARETQTDIIGQDGEENSTMSVTDAFTQYIDGLKNSDFVLVSKQEFKNIIIYDYRERFSNNNDSKDAKEKYKSVVSNAQLECVRLFSEFCANNLDTKTKTTLNRLINLTYNRSMLINMSKIPVGFVCSSKFGSADFSLKPVQVEAFKYAVSRNNWCLALTVGFGKTSVCIAIISYFVSSGIIKRPLIVVPKPVISNWIKESMGYWINNETKKISFTPVDGYKRMYGIYSGTGLDVANFKNLDKPNRKKADKYFSSKTKDEPFITIVTYEALEKLYIGNEETRNFVIAEWKKILTSEGAEENEDAKEWSGKMGKLEESLNKVDREADIDIEELGFDSMFVDEAHRLKNMFVGVSADKTNKVNSSFKGTSSARALRGFYISMYLQKQNGRTGFLTATPFSNTPLEVYTMLCFLGYNELCKNNLNKISSFVELFFNETTEPKVNKDNRIVYDIVMKNYKNKAILNTLLSNVFLYKDDPTEAGLSRPCIIRYPNKDMKIILKMSPIQKVQRDILVGDIKSVRDFIETEQDMGLVSYAEELLDKFNDNILSVKERNRGGSIVASSKISALSPFAGSPVSISFNTNEYWSELYYNSPKIRFTIDCINSMIEYHRDREESTSSFLIYCEVGLNILPYFKEALEQVCGFKRNLSVIEDEDEDKEKYDEVEIIEGTASTDKEANRRDKVQTLFNMGKVKVIIGTSTIKEGLNLQVNCATLFILTPTWNSTDIDQVEGRIHRQGNRFGYARVITPLVARSLDSFIYQKYEEKKSRLKDIWDSGGSSSDSDDLNIEIKADKQKELILDNAKEIAKIRGDMASRLKSNILNKAKEDYDAVMLAISRSGEYNKLASFHLGKLGSMLGIAQTNYGILNKLLLEIESDDKIKSSIKGLKTRITNLTFYYTELIDTIKKANESKAIVDVVGILNRSYNQRTYDITSNYDNKLDLKEYFVENGYNRADTNNLFVEDIFAIIDVRTKIQSYEDGFDNSLKKLKEIYGQNVIAEKYILEPEGLSLTSNSEDLDNLVEKYKSVLDSIQVDIDTNFVVNYGGNIAPKQEYIDKLQEEAQIELDEENKLSLMSEELGSYFSSNTNVQLSYMKDDVDLEKCVLKTVESDDTNGIIEHPVFEVVDSSTKGKQPSKLEQMAILRAKLESLKPIIPPSEYYVVKSSINEHENSIETLYNLMEIMPDYREQDAFGYSAFAILHYFYGGTDIYITEKEKDSPYAFSFTILNGDLQNAEWGSQSIDELTSIKPMQLDLYFTPRPLHEILSNNHDLEKEPKIMDSKTLARYSDLETKIKIALGEISVESVEDEMEEIISEPISAEKQEIIDELKTIEGLMEIFDGKDLIKLKKEKKTLEEIIDLF
jgi:hypothetical protein